MTTHNRTAIQTKFRSISYDQLAKDVAAAGRFLAATIGADVQRVLVGSSIHPYVGWVLRIALLAGRYHQVQATLKMPAQQNAVTISGVEQASDPKNLTFTLANINDWRSDETPLPVQDIFNSLENVSEPLITIYTSGSTGRPKGVVYSGSVLFKRLVAHATTFPSREGDIAFNQMGPDTAGGLAIALRILQSGTTLLVNHVDAFGAGDEQDRALIQQSTVLMTSTGFWANKIKSQTRWLNKENRRVFLGGSRVYAGLVNYLRTYVANEVNVIYGSTEVGLVAGMNAEGILSQPSSVGKIIEGVEIKIVKESKEVGCDVLGAVTIRSPWSALGYEDSPDDTDFQDGWFMSGDLGMVDQEGYLFIEGRSGDLLNYGGTKFLASDVETQLVALEGITDAFVTVLRSTAQESLVLMLVANTDISDLEGAVRPHLPNNAPAKIMLVDAIPRNEMGKIGRQALTLELENQV